MKLSDNAVIKCCGECSSVQEGLLHSGEFSPYVYFCPRRLNKQIQWDTIDPSCPLKSVEVIDKINWKVDFDEYQDRLFVEIQQGNTEEELDKYANNIEKIIIVRREGR